MAQRREPIQPSAADHVTSGDNAPAVITLAADPGLRHELSGVFYSYSGAPTGGLLTVAVAGSTVREWHIAIQDERGRGFDPPLQTDLNEAMVVTLSAAGAGIIGKLNIDVESIIGRS